MKPDAAKKSGIWERPAGGSGTPYGLRLMPGHKAWANLTAAGREAMAGWTWAHSGPTLASLHLMFQ